MHGRCMGGAWEVCMEGAWEGMGGAWVVHGECMGCTGVHGVYGCAWVCMGVGGCG